MPPEPKTKQDPAQLLQTLMQELNTVFPERREVIRGAVCALLTGEHILLLGPPGTAKSALARAVAGAFGAIYFERLLTKFSTPEELFGSISLQALEKDHYKRITTGKLPEAEIAFIDEIFKANSAILNSLLSLINERLFHNDGAPTRCPLTTMFGASNELTEGKDLEALFDRFLLRYDVQYLFQPNHLKTMLKAPDPAVQTRLTMEQLHQLQNRVEAVKITDEMVDGLITMREACQSEGIVASDRRWKKSIKLAQAAAFLVNETETSPDDLTILTDTLWREPKERPKVQKLVGRICDPAGVQATEILDAARETASTLANQKFRDQKAYMQQGVNVLEDFGNQMTKLTDLQKSAGKRAQGTIKEALGKISMMREEIGKHITKRIGLPTSVQKAVESEK